MSGSGGYDTDPGTPGTQLDPALLAAIQEAVAAGMQAAPFTGPVVSPLLMTTTPKLGLKLPGMDDPALITDINDNMVILDNSITETSASTLSNKTLTAPVINNPTINGWANALHNHLNAAGAGGLDGAAIISGTLGTGLLLREGATGSTLIDPVVRDQIWFGQQGTALAPDVTVQRTAPGALLVAGGAGSTKAWIEMRSPTATGSARIGQPVGGAGTQGIWIAANVDYDGTNWVRDDVTKNAWHVSLNDPSFALYQGKPGANPLTAWLQRLTVNAFGNLALQPDSTANGEALFIYKGVTRALTHHPARMVVRLDQRSLIVGDVGGEGVRLLSNLYFDASGAWRVIEGGANAGLLQISTGALSYNWANGATTTDGVPTFATFPFTVGPGDTAFGGSAFGRLQIGYLHPLNAGNPGIKAGCAYVLYDGGGENWAGFSRDINGNAWLRTGLNNAAHGEWVWSTDGSITIRVQNGNVQGLMGIGSRTGNFRVGSLVANSLLECYGIGVVPFTNGFMSLGQPDMAWTTVYASTGTIQPSTLDTKHDIAPLDPAACAAAVLGTDWCSFAYNDPPPPTPIPAPEGEDDAAKAQREQMNTTMQASYETRMTEERPERFQKGYVLQSPDHTVDDLFGVGGTHASPQSDLAVVACALQLALKRIAALEDEVAGLAPAA